jgi:predicted amidohydrolase
MPPGLRVTIYTQVERQSLHLDLAPLDLAWSNPAVNASLMEEAIVERLRANPEIARESRIFIFPELTLTGFVTEHSDRVALKNEGSEVRAVRDLAARHGVAILFGYPEATGNKPFNTLLLLDDHGRDLARYRKQHLFTAGKAPEAAAYERGQSGTLVKYRGWRIGFGVCFDLRFPSMFQPYAEAPADLVILPACWIGGPGKTHQFQTLSAARAIELQTFFAALSRSGSDPNAGYAGEIFCFSPLGELMPHTNGFDLDPAELEKARRLQVSASVKREYHAAEGGLSKK